MHFSLFEGDLCLVFILSDLSSFAIILTRKRELAVMLLLSCLVSGSVLWLFLTVPMVGLQCVLVVFPDHTHLRFGMWGIPSMFK